MSLTTCGSVRELASSRCHIRLRYQCSTPSVLEESREALKASLEEAQKIGRVWKNRCECLESQLTETIDDYDKKLTKKDEIIKSREEELKHKDALLKLHKNKRKREDSASPEDV